MDMNNATRRAEMVHLRDLRRDLMNIRSVTTVDGSQELIPSGRAQKETASQPAGSSVARHNMVDNLVGDLLGLSCESCRDAGSRSD